MNARDVIEDVQMTMQAAREELIHGSTDSFIKDLAQEVIDIYLSALAAAGLAIYDTRTHAAVPREMSEAIYDAGRRGQEDGDLYDVWREQIAAAEAEAKETE